MYLHSEEEPPETPSEEDEDEEVEDLPLMRRDKKQRGVLDGGDEDENW